jgi:hypothetical protein
MFGKANCKLCGHLKEKHPETLKDPDIIKLEIPKIMEKYFT